MIRFMIRCVEYMRILFSWLAITVCFTCSTQLTAAQALDAVKIGNWDSLPSLTIETDDNMLSFIEIFKKHGVAPLLTSDHIKQFQQLCLTLQFGSCTIPPVEASFYAFDKLELQPGVRIIQEQPIVILSRQLTVRGAEIIRPNEPLFQLAVGQLDLEGTLSIKVSSNDNWEDAFNERRTEESILFSLHRINIAFINREQSAPVGLYALGSLTEVQLLIADTNGFPLIIQSSEYAKLMNVYLLLDVPDTIWELAARAYIQKQFGIVLLDVPDTIWEMAGKAYIQKQFGAVPLDAD
jgi:hypothetical protein